jgi:hypothetical protein
MGRQINDIMLLENPFVVGSIKWKFIEDFILNYHEIGPGSIDILKNRVNEIQDYTEIKDWLISTLIYFVWLKTTYWRICSIEKMRQSKWKCEKCSSGRSLQVHHSTHIERGTEHDNMDKLQTLCCQCHITKVHGRDLVEGKKQKKQNKLRTEEEILDRLLLLIPSDTSIEKHILEDLSGLSRDKLEEHIEALIIRCKVSEIHNKIRKRMDFGAE